MSSSPLLLLLLLLLAIAATCSSSSADNVLRIVSDDDGLYCDSWKFSVETGDAGPWSVVPHKCAAYVASYMTGRRYLSDARAVARDARVYAARVAPAGSRDAWVFDIDETLLSNLPYYNDHGFGSEAFNETLWDEWVAQAKAPALPESLRLYGALRKMGFRLVLLTGRGEAQRGLTESNLLRAGYTSWEKLIMRNATDEGKTAVVYKSEKRGLLVAEGYKIHGNSGDQWSDLLGSPMATRSFKLPNPMYYIA